MFDCPARRKTWIGSGWTIGAGNPEITSRSKCERNIDFLPWVRYGPVVSAGYSSPVDEETLHLRVMEEERFGV
jgi:hypothetical protein